MARVDFSCTGYWIRQALTTSRSQQQQDNPTPSLGCPHTVLPPVRQQHGACGVSVDRQDYRALVGTQGVHTVHDPHPASLPDSQENTCCAACWLRVSETVALLTTTGKAWHWEATAVSLYPSVLPWAAPSASDTNLGVNGKRVDTDTVSHSRSPSRTRENSVYPICGGSAARAAFVGSSLSIVREEVKGGKPRDYSGLAQGEVERGVPGWILAGIVLGRSQQLWYEHRRRDQKSVCVSQQWGHCYLDNYLTPDQEGGAIHFHHHPGESASLSDCYPNLSYQITIYHVYRSCGWVTSVRNPTLSMY